MDNAYIFEIEEALRKSLFQFNKVIKADKQDLDRYKSSIYKKENIELKWADKINAYLKAYENLHFLIARAIMIDHERVICLRKIEDLKREVRTLNSYLKIMTICKRIEIDELVKIRTKQEVDRLCNMAQAELMNDLSKLGYTDDAVLSINGKEVA
ncbi:hypothetical protein EFA69_19010 [Rufibacter immobilis]|uniref:Uncharacterized protein n=1 Tax=Rufibacter immobilis TaxID=1348778 RepID=A0A3M9MTD8_9BACT|nr:hypothetical protein [Rufibacter immobilis]RNI28163.1 hypothetical protein EFA69_19010 [Rufibacter immobilis]